MQKEGIKLIMEFWNLGKKQNECDKLKMFEQQHKFCWVSHPDIGRMTSLGCLLIESSLICLQDKLFMLQLNELWMTRKLFPSLGCFYPQSDAA